MSKRTIVLLFASMVLVNGHMKQSAVLETTNRNEECNI